MLLALVALATGLRLKDVLLTTFGDEMEPINAMDWKTIDALIDNQKKILADKKVIVDGQEVNKDFAFKLIEQLSAINWSHLHETLMNHKGMVENEVASRGKNKAIVTEALRHTLRMAAVNWKMYFQNFGNYHFLMFIIITALCFVSSFNIYCSISP